MDVRGDLSALKPKVRPDKGPGDILTVPAEVPRRVSHWIPGGEESLTAVENHRQALLPRGVCSAKQPFVAFHQTRRLRSTCIDIHNPSQARLFRRHGIINHSPHEFRRWRLE